nr:D-lactate dehydrogenase [Ensifer sp. ENS06]
MAPFNEADQPLIERERLVGELKCAVGNRHVLTGASAMRRFVRGFRYGGGDAVAVVRPGNLVEYWRVVQCCVARGAVIISQASNTGLTGGSTPFGHDYDRVVVVVNTMRIKGLHLLGGGRQVLAFPGTTLNELEMALEPLGREPHSVIGSSCLGASVVGGICNNSGGSLIKRGPAYTEMALYARVDEHGKLRLVNDLGIHIDGSPIEVLQRLERRGYASGNITWGGVASDKEYQRHVRDVEASTPARFNADRRRLHGVSGSAGKLAVFAVRLDTFEVEKAAKVYYVGTNSPADLTHIRRSALGTFDELPMAAEYIHRDAFDVAADYGKDTYILVKWLGTRCLPVLFAAKSKIDAIAERFSFLPSSLTDRVLQGGSRMLPKHLPRRLLYFRDKYEHHLMLKVSGSAVESMEALLCQMFPSTRGDFFLCTPEEGEAAFLHRFAVAGAAIRCNAMHREDASGIVALDIALPRNNKNWVEHCRPRRMPNCSNGSITATFSARCSTRTTSLDPAIIRLP